MRCLRDIILNEEIGVDWLKDKFGNVMGLILGTLTVLAGLVSARIGVKLGIETGQTWALTIPFGVLGFVVIAFGLVFIYWIVQDIRKKA